LAGAHVRSTERNLLPSIDLGALHDAQVRVGYELR
jgi:hypothetical protein